MALWRQIVINDCLQQLIFSRSNTSKSFSFCVLIVLLRVSRSKYILFGKVCGKELSFGRRWIQKGIHVYFYFMIFCNINNVCNNCHFISFSDLRSSENKIDSAGVRNSWRGDRILKQLILGMRDSEDMKKYKRFVTHCIFILYMFYFRTFTTGLHRNISLFRFSCFHTHRSCYNGNQVHTDRGYCIIPKNTPRRVNRVQTNAF